jgi:hypothetical protein
MRQNIVYVDMKMKFSNNERQINIYKEWRMIMFKLYRSRFDRVNIKVV